MIITLEQYGGHYLNHPDFTEEKKLNAVDLLRRAHILTGVMEKNGVQFHINPLTGSYISGENDGGFRLQNSKTGATHSQHKNGNALDWYDPKNEMDAWLKNNEGLITAIGLWFEIDYKTPKWCHMQRVAPGSGRRFFIP